MNRLLLPENMCMSICVSGRERRTRSHEILNDKNLSLPLPSAFIWDSEAMSVQSKILVPSIQEREKSLYFSPIVMFWAPQTCPRSITSSYAFIEMLFPGPSAFLILFPVPILFYLVDSCLSRYHDWHYSSRNLHKEIYFFLYAFQSILCYFGLHASWIIVLPLCSLRKWQLLHEGRNSVCCTPGCMSGRLLFI